MILITGATGFIGKHLVKKLKELNYGLCCLLRDERQKGLFEKINADYVVTSLENYKKLSTDLSKIKFSKIVHLASSLNSSKREAEADYRCTLNLVRLCRQRKIKKIIFASSYLADTNYKSHYGASKRKSEESIKKSGLSYAILRLSQVYGPDSAKHLSRTI